MLCQLKAPVFRSIMRGTVRKVGLRQGGMRPPSLSGSPSTHVPERHHECRFAVPTTASHTHLNGHRLSLPKDVNQLQILACNRESERAPPQIRFVAPKQKLGGRIGVENGTFLINHHVSVRICLQQSVKLALGGIELTDVFTERLLPTLSLDRKADAARQRCFLQAHAGYAVLGTMAKREDTTSDIARICQGYDRHTGQRLPELDQGLHPTITGQLQVQQDELSWLAGKRPQGRIEVIRMPALESTP